jgi:hypothetical protein
MHRKLWQSSDLKILTCRLFLRVKRGIVKTLSGSSNSYKRRKTAPSEFLDKELSRIKKFLFKRLKQL